ncbi:MAG TPA: hypothetical protein VG737_02265 [Cyclobacteriaceae bacterium]|nr:hypothetical protein [Cyclobacteriaceae bacterium]
MRQSGLTIILFTFIALLAGCGLNERKEKLDKAQADADYIMNNLNNPDILTHFPVKNFPTDEFPPFLETLKSHCDFDTKRGKFVDSFAMVNDGKDQTAYIYEYILNCDSIRFIYTYDLDQKEPELSGFLIEGIEQPNKMIVDPKKQLLNSEAR